MCFSFELINYCFNTLTASGFVKIYYFNQNQNQNQNEFGYDHLLTPCSISEKAVIIGILLKRNLQEYMVLKPEFKALKLLTVAVNGQNLINT